MVSKALGIACWGWCPGEQRPSYRCVYVNRGTTQTSGKPSLHSSMACSQNVEIFPLNSAPLHFVCVCVHYICLPFSTLVSSSLCLNVGFGSEGWRRRCDVLHIDAVLQHCVRCDLPAPFRTDRGINRPHMLLPPSQSDSHSPRLTLPLPLPPPLTRMSQHAAVSR